MSSLISYYFILLDIPGNDSISVFILVFIFDILLLAVCSSSLYHFIRYSSRDIAPICTSSLSCSLFVALLSMMLSSKLIVILFGSGTLKILKYFPIYIISSTISVRASSKGFSCLLIVRNRSEFSDTTSVAVLPTRTSPIL